MIKNVLGLLASLLVAALAVASRIAVIALGIWAFFTFLA